MTISIVDMKDGESGAVTEVQGGFGLAQRVENMGIRKGKSIKKLSSSLWRGPQTVLVDNAKIAIGYGMASKIFVDVTR